MGDNRGTNTWAIEDIEFKGDDDVGISTLSDEEEEKEEYGRSNVVSGTRQKDRKVDVRPDIFMHALEVETQVVLTWRSSISLYAKMFGCKYCAEEKNVGINNLKEKKK